MEEYHNIYKFKETLFAQTNPDDYLELFTLPLRPHSLTSARVKLVDSTKEGNDISRLLSKE